MHAVFPHFCRSGTQKQGTICDHMILSSCCWSAALQSPWVSFSLTGLGTSVGGFASLCRQRSLFLGPADLKSVVFFSWVVGGCSGMRGLDKLP